MTDVVEGVLSCEEDLLHRSAGWILLLLANLPHRVARQEGLLLLGPQLEVGMHPCRTEGLLHASMGCRVSGPRDPYDGMPCVRKAVPLTRQPVK